LSPVHYYRRNMRLNFIAIDVTDCRHGARAKAHVDMANARDAAMAHEGYVPNTISREQFGEDDEKVMETSFSAIPLYQLDELFQQERAFPDAADLLTGRAGRLSDGFSTSDRRGHAAGLIDFAG
jgi:hypothetical protein